MDPSVNRRSFLKTSTVAAAGATVLATQAVARAQNANQRLRIGMIGPGGRGFGAHVRTLCNLKNEGRKIDIVAVAEVYQNQRDMVANFIKETNGNEVAKYVDYLEMIEKENLDAVCIGTPDHWHHKQILDSLKAGLHVYCEKPMTKNVEEALEVVDVWKASGKVMQVGVQGTSDPALNQARELIENGKIGKVLMFQTEYFRNSRTGQWRDYPLVKETTPKTVDWQRWLGVKEGLSEDRPFDREIYSQWRRFWPYGSGMFTDLFVHRVTFMLKATGLRYPKRVTGAGGIYLEYDGRDVPDVASVIADYPEGVQGLVSSSMAAQVRPHEHLIRGHFGALALGGQKLKFYAERPQITLDSKIVDEEIDVVNPIGDHDHVHFSNWIDAMEAGNPALVNNDPELGAAAVSTVILGAQSYRNDQIYYIDDKRRPLTATEYFANGGEPWPKTWEKLSAARGQAKHIPGWKAGVKGSEIVDPPYMGLAGPWIDGNPPEKG